MSKPTPNYFCVHTGYFRNDRTLALHDRIGIHAFCVMPMLWAWAGENQMDGDVSHLTPRRYQQIFRSCNLDLTKAQTKRIVDAIHVVGFIQDGKLHSWDKFNRQFCEFDARRSIRQTAANIRWKKAVERGASDGEGDHAETNGHGETASKKLWVIDQALKTATGPAKRKLKTQRKELLSQSTGVDLDEEDSAPPAAAPRQTRPGLPKKKLTRTFSGMRAAADGNPVPE